MKVLLIGSGGREHSLAWKIAQSSLVTELFVAPGNAGIAQVAKCVDINVTDIKALVSFVKENNIDLTVVGPEAPLVKGIVDEFEKENLKIFGPNALAARLEASKVFAKQIMLKAGVPTAGCDIFDDAMQAKDYINKKGAPLVIKADGLAQGKGVIVAKTKEEALAAITSIMENKIFGESGNQVIIEECLVGEEASILVLCDGKNFIPLVSSQDHKRIFDNDQGPNTGGMGAYSPAPVISDEAMKAILKTVIKPVIKEMIKIGCSYKGVLYAGIMMTQDGPKVLEFNVRFGDPETQAILPRLKDDLVQVMLAVIGGQLKNKRLHWLRDNCVCVVVSSKGYPGDYEKGKEITGLDEFNPSQKLSVFSQRNECNIVYPAREGALTFKPRGSTDKKDVFVFHAGTKLSNGKILTSGGRILGVTALGKNIQEAINKSYKALDKIKFDGMHFRRDIGARAIDRR